MVTTAALPRRYRSRGFSAPPVHTLSRQASDISELTLGKHTIVVAPQGSWLHKRLGHVPEAALPTGLHPETHTLRTIVGSQDSDRDSDAVKANSSTGHEQKFGGQDRALQHNVNKGNETVAWRYVLCGETSIATLYAAYSFAEDVLGVRFYPHGDVIPSVPSVWGLTLRNLETKVYNPEFSVRGVSLCPWYPSLVQDAETVRVRLRRLRLERERILRHAVTLPRRVRCSRILSAAQPLPLGTVVAGQHLGYLD